YQLGCAGSSFSYFAGGRFTLIEARLNDTNAQAVRDEMATCGVETAHCLHITSWDSDHCSLSELPVLLTTLRPAKIECPGYEPSSDSGKNCRGIIEEYREQERTSKRPVVLRYVTPEYIAGLDAAEELAFRDVMYPPRSIVQW